jgi:hypothetical protein
MRLADHFLAARGTVHDMFGFVSSLGPWIERAERFEIADEVARACGELVYPRPSSLLAALPLCRLPYEIMWVECRGGLGKYDTRKDFDAAPTPVKQGVLIESMPGGQVGYMTFAWIHMRDDIEHAVNITPIGVYFDWREDGDVKQIVRNAHGMILKDRGADPGDILRAFTARLERFGAFPSREAVSAFFTGSGKWAEFAHNDRELAAIMSLDRHMHPGLIHHGAELAATILLLAKSQDEATHFLSRWEADMQGEGTWVQCLLAMLNSKNPVVEHTPVDLTKLNKSRRKSGKPMFLAYSKTRLAMSRSQGRIADARGVSREAARAHLVRGHFKIRRTGVFWWSPFLRGDARMGAVERKQYEVVHGA